MVTYSSEYTGYVYIWYDTIARLFYIGGHYGRVDDSYICSNKPMKRAYKLRPNTFKFRVLEYVSSNKTALRQAEQRWLDMIKDHELMLSDNVKAGTCRYYNVKKCAAGGSHKGHKKNRTMPAWNKGYNKEELQLRKQGLLCFMSDKPKPTFNERGERTAHAWNKGLRMNQPPWNKGMRKKKPPIAHTCACCGKKFETLQKNSKTCSRSCAGKIAWMRGTAIPGFQKGQTAWNKGIPNTLSAVNGKKGAAKLSAKVKGRRLAYRDDGSRYWVYPDKSGEIR
jgi:hypothetical protein